MSPISSRKTRAPCGDLEEPELALAGVGERALLVAEELALEQRLGDRGAVDRRRTGWPRRSLHSWMARATSSLPVPLSPRISAVLALLRATRASWSFRWAMAGGLPMISTSGALASRPCMRLTFWRSRRSRGAADGGRQILDVERLLQVVERAEAQRRHSRLDCPMRRHQDDRQSGCSRRHFFSELEPVAVGQPQVGQHDVGPERREALERLAHAGGPLHLGPESLELGVEAEANRSSSSTTSTRTSFRVGGRSGGLRACAASCTLSSIGCEFKLSTARFPLNPARSHARRSWQAS